MSDVPVIWFMNDTVFMTDWKNYVLENIILIFTNLTSYRK